MSGTGKNLSGSCYMIKHPEHWLLLILLGALASHGLSLLISIANIDNILGSYESVKESLIGSWSAFDWIKVCLFASVAEELIFRGILYLILKKLLSVVSGGRSFKDKSVIIPAALISSLLFGIIHLNLAQGTYAFLYGILLCFVMDAYQNIIAPVMVHAAANAFSMILEYSGFSYKNLWTEIIVMIVFLAASAAICIIVIRKTALPANGN